MRGAQPSVVATRHLMTWRQTMRWTVAADSEMFRTAARAPRPVRMLDAVFRYLDASSTKHLHARRAAADIHAETLARAVAQALTSELHSSARRGFG